MENYLEKTQTLVSTRQKAYIDCETGEKILFDQITKRIYGSKQFWKCYLMDFLCVLGIIDSRQLDVFIYIVENTDPNRNIFIGTYKEISAETKVSSATIARIMKKLQANNFIRKIHNGAWYVNPNILMKGGERKRQILLSYYQTDNNNSITIERKTINEIKVGYQDNPGEQQQELFLTPKGAEKNE